MSDLGGLLRAKRHELNAWVGATVLECGLGHGLPFGVAERLVALDELERMAFQVQRYLSLHPAVELSEDDLAEVSLFVATGLCGSDEFDADEESDADESEDSHESNG